MVGQAGRDEHPDLVENKREADGQANKQGLEVLKGTSGLQAGTSSPGGLLNLVVKRPRERVRDASLAWTQDGTLEGALDVGERSNGFGWRVNASAARLDPQLHASRGERWLASGAVDWRLGTGTFIEAEVEASRQSPRVTITPSEGRANEGANIWARNVSIPPGSWTSTRRTRRKTGIAKIAASRRRPA